MSVIRPVNIRLTLISGCYIIIFAGSIFFIATISSICRISFYVPSFICPISDILFSDRIYIVQHYGLFQHSNNILFVFLLYYTVYCISVVASGILVHYLVFLMIQYLHMLVCPYDVCLTVQSQVWTSLSFLAADCTFSGQVNCWS